MNLDGLLEALKKDEGEVKENGLHVLYKCPADHWTIGYGHNLDARPGIKMAEASLGISDDRAEELLTDDAIHAFKDAADLVSNFVILNDVRQSVLANMAFNMGKATLRKFKKMIAAVEVKDFELAAKEMADSAWYSQVGGRAKRLTEEMRTGIV